MIEKLKLLLDDLQNASVTGYQKYEVTIVTLIEEAFGEDHNFTQKVRKIKSGWGVKSSIARMYGQASEAEYNNDKYSEYFNLLNEAIEFIEKYDFSDRGEVQVDNKKVFIVHGHDSELKFQMSDWLQRIGLKPIILHLQANMGISTIIEKIERNSDVGCAIILMTADDFGKAKGEENFSPRARQNVIFEAGYFIGKLDRSKVIMLHDEGIEAPGDLAGCVYITADSYGGWKEAVRTEFAGIGIEYKDKLI